MDEGLKPKLAIAVSIFLGICLLISGFMLWSLRDVFRAVDNFDSTPMSELESEEYSPDLSNTAMISGIEGNAEFKFPPSSREIYAYTTGFRDIFIQTRFTINAEELQELISTTRCDEPLRPVGKPAESSISKFDWWKIAEAKTLVGCSGSTENFGQMVFIDMTNSEEYIVYIEGGTH